VAHLVLIYGLVTPVGLLTLWYLCFTRYNRRKGNDALRCVEAACLGRGEVIEPTWLGASRLRARLRFSSHWVEDACITVRLRPRPIPPSWFLSLWRKQQETLTFEANLGCAPDFNLEVWRHRWFTRNSPDDDTGSRQWSLFQPGPVILTTRGRWGQELSPVVNTLMTSRGHNLISVRFRPDSPHLTATVTLETLSDRQAGAGFLAVLRDLAAGASTSRH
jgi:hypothetical protein